MSMSHGDERRCVMFGLSKKDGHKAVHVVYDNDNSVKITTLVNNPGNRDWDNIQEWLDAGNTIQEAD